MSGLSVEELESYCVDRSGWPAGPWDTEPDREQWQHAGYACLVTRHPRWGHLCGYVGVDRAHPCYGKTYEEMRVEVHGGLTYGDTCCGHICHVAEPGMPDDVFWLGFDASHAGDLSPAMHPIGDPHAAYRDWSYMRAEVESLAEQLRTLTVERCPAH